MLQYEITTQKNIYKIILKYKKKSIYNRKMPA